MSFDLKGKIALVTGGANGIGLAYVKELLKNGVKGVAITDISPNGNDVAAELNKQYGDGTVIFITTNSINKAELAVAFEKAIEHFKTLDVVINNAGIMFDSDWEKEVALNCNAVVEGSLLAIKYMGKNNGGKGGVVANIASILGLQSLSGCPVYVGTKHFVLGMTRSFGTDYYWNLTGIKFVTMCPGVTETPLISEAGKFALKGFPNLGEVLAKELGSLPAQPPRNVAEGMITIITKGQNGSVWVSEGNEPIYEVEIPDRLTLRKK
ncbi:15-hydroxyprostaglandin dehydrogenase [NAD(+)]-like [Anthonomus grandis grandis]|uniref:15-hydroxyprostaglandin dehydrogenase [NAD(+)]-like n=1 Tax=Anthonomus grandis grandis TaxID=2921223 RepID=UPI0021669B18|nr:15-hydroxyprostaglandin dehydrogenase [NAD(+)]-like [Anthonomus grandis grandis]